MTQPPRVSSKRSALEHNEFRPTVTDTVLRSVVAPRRSLVVRVVQHRDRSTNQAKWNGGRRSGPLSECTKRPGSGSSVRHGPRTGRGDVVLELRPARFEGGSCCIPLAIHKFSRGPTPTTFPPIG